MKNTTSKKLCLEKFQIAKLTKLSEIVGGSKTGYIGVITEATSKTTTPKDEYTAKTPETSIIKNISVR